MVTHGVSRCIKIIFYSWLLLMPAFVVCLPEGAVDHVLRSLTDAHYSTVAIQADGKAVVAGYAVVDNRSCWIVARYHHDGNIDTSFGTQGRVITRFAPYETESQAQAVVLQMDGKIVVGGFTNAIRGKRKWCLARYHTNGSLDESFFGCNATVAGTVVNCFENSYETSMVNDIAIQPDGKIVAAGMCSIDGTGTLFTVACYTGHGSLDTDFNAQGIHGKPGMATAYFSDAAAPNDEAKAVALDARGNIVAAGYSVQAGHKKFALARFNAHGCLDSSLVGDAREADGALTTSLQAGETDACAYDIAIQSDGKIVVAGYSNSNNQKNAARFALVRYHHNGSLDRSFGGYGLASVPGTLMSSFGPDEKEARAHALVVQQDGKLVVGGTVCLQSDTCFGLARYNTDGTVDYSFNHHGVPVGKVVTKVQNKSTDAIFGLAIQEDGCVVAVGKTQNGPRSYGAIARYCINDTPLLVPCVSTSNAATVFDRNIHIIGKVQNPAYLEIFVNDELKQKLTCSQIHNEWRYTIPNVVEGMYTVKVLAQYSNGNICLASEPVTFRVNQQPHAVRSSALLYSNEKVSGHLLAHGGSGNYQFNIISCTNGDAELDNNVYTFTPSIEEGQAIITFKVVDAHTRFESIGTITITILALPRFALNMMAGYADKRVDGYLVDFIHGGDRNFTFKCISAEHGTAFINKDSYFRFTPDKDFVGTANFEFEFTDAHEHTCKVSVPLHIYPELKAGTVEAEGVKNGTVKGRLIHAGCGGAAPYTFALVPDSAVNGIVTIESNGDFQFEPMRGYEGQGSFAYTLADKYGTVSNQARVVVMIHPLPEAAGAQWIFYVDETFNDCLKNKVTKGKEPYTFCIAKDAEHGSVELAANGMVTFVPQSGFSGKDTFEYMATDARNGESNHACIDLNIAPALSVGNTSILLYEDALLHGNLCSAVHGGIPPYSFVHDKRNDITIHNDGSFILEPKQVMCAEDRCTYEVRDSYRAQALGTITTSVIRVPQAKAAHFETLEGKDLESSLLCLAEGGVAPYVFEKVDDRTTRTNAVVREDGRFTFYPDQKTTGKSSFKYKFIDANGYMSNTAAIDIMVHALPQVSDTQFKTYMNTPVKGALRDRIVAGTPPYSFALVGSPCNGMVTLHEGGIFMFYPNKDFKGIGSFQYQIQDRHTGISTVATATVLMCDVIATQPVVLVTKENAPVAFDLTSLVAGGEPPYIFALAQEYPGLQINEYGSLAYMPEAGFHGSLTCEYQVTDVHKNSVKNKITIAVTEMLNSSSHTFEIMQNQTFTSSIQSLVKKGLPPYKFELLKQVTNGTLVMVEDGPFTFTPTPGFSGNCSFWYRVRDAHGDVSKAGFIIIHVVPFLALKDSSYTAFINSPVSGVLQKPKHKDTARHTFECVESLSGTVDLKPDGSFTFMPHKDFSGVAQFKFRIMNKDVAMSDSATVYITVVEQPSPLPVITQQEAQQAYQFLNNFLKQ